MYKKRGFMSVDQEHIQSVESQTNDQALLDTDNSLSSKDKKVHTNEVTGPSWQKPIKWFLTHTFTPQWLPSPWNHPVVGYLVAIILQFIAIIVTTLLTRLFSSFIYTGLLEVLLVALISFNWGVGPSLIATLAGAILLNFIVQPPHFTLTFNDTSSIEVSLFLLVGIAISIVASQIE